ncbi:DUF3558 domain-containing protein [Streptomyces sp. WAC 01529]|uniref:DUF3558 domain-containing protein n=1 Tax=Streptomyces sp. WAC 01529 TaxID=2203205 RepID=UPI000F6FCD0A|nr:DUF3558 domain-containing protein [Streptomyces sp. WAC 01529]AZM54738.1 DUF3558 domain-containing protein [Streptomyces sp. WAC 01529]
MHRPAQRQRQRLSRIIVCAAAVPVILVASGCSSDSGSGSDGAKKDAGAKASASKKAGDKPATVEKAAYSKLPEPCEVLSKKTLADLVPKAKDKGKAGTSTDTALRGSCSWDSLDNNGVDGSQFRWLRVSLMRFDSDASLGSGAKRAQDNFAKQVADAQATKDAKGVKAEPVQGVGEQATLVRYDLKKDKDTFKQQTFVTRVENAVVTVDYNGAGLAGDKSPDAGDLSKAAQKAAKEAAASVVAANEGGAKAPSGASEKPKKDDAKKDDPKKDEPKKDEPKKAVSKSDDSTSEDSASDDSKPKAKAKS